jgi:UDP-glucose 4-epimerase
MNLLESYNLKVKFLDLINQFKLNYTSFNEYDSGTINYQDLYDDFKGTFYILNIEGKLTLFIKEFRLQDITRDYIRWPFYDIEFDCVIHMAAEVAVGRSVLNPTLYYLTNTLGTLNVLKNLNYKRFVFASTGSAEGLGSPYGISKRMAEDIVKQYCSDNNIPFTIFRFYNVIGSDGIEPTNPDGLFYNLIKAKETGLFRLFGDDYNTRDGSCERDYTHVNEICLAVEKSINKSTNQIENLGHGVGTTVKEMIEIFKKINNCKFNVIVDPRRKGDLERSVLSNKSSFMSSLYSIEEILNVTNKGTI